MATNGVRNKRAGSQHERDEVLRHKKYFHNVATTRACNRKRDGDGIDVCNQDEYEVGRLPLDISCKSSTKAALSYVKLIEEMAAGRIKVILHRRTKKSEGGRFMTKGEYAIMEREGYEQFLQHVYAIQILRKKLPEVIEELEKNYDLKLLDVPKQIVL